MEILIVNNTSPFVIDIVNMIKDLNILFNVNYIQKLKPKNYHYMEQSYYQEDEIIIERQM